MRLTQKGKQTETRDCEPLQQLPCSRFQKALLCIDLQHLGCSKGDSALEDHQQTGVSKQDISNYLQYLQRVVIPNVRQLQDIFRGQGFEVIHFRIQSLTRDGRDRSPEHKALGVHAAPESRLAQFLPEVAPRDDEIVFNKTASGIFTATNIEYVLRNLCISDVYITGVYTNECISSAVRGASDLGFRVILVADGTAAITPELHRASLLTLDGRYARACTTEQIITDLK